MSCAHPVTTYLPLVGEERLPGDVIRDVKRYRSRCGTVKLNVALSELPSFPAWDQDGDVHKGLAAMSPSIEYLERAWDDAKYGRMCEHPYVEVVFPTAHEPEGLAPTGKHLMLGFSQYGPYELGGGLVGRRRPRGVRAPRPEGARRVRARARGRSSSRSRCSRPKDIEDRFGLIGGNIMQGELTPDQMF